MVDPFKLLIFPEGTDFDAKTKAKSDVFGEKEGRPYLTYLLHPRTTGIPQVQSFSFCTLVFFFCTILSFLYNPSCHPSGYEGDYSILVR